MRTLALITSVGPQANIEWFRKSAMSVKGIQTEVEWLIAAPNSIRKEVESVLRQESLSATVTTMLTNNIALARNTLINQTDANYIMQFDADDALVGVGVDELVRKVSSEGRVWGAAPYISFDEETSPSPSLIQPHTSMVSFPEGVVPLTHFSYVRGETRDEIPFGSIAIHPGSCIVRRSAFMDVGGYDQTLGNRWEDYVPFMHLNKSHEGAWSSIPTLLYRQSDSSTTGAVLNDDEIAYLDSYLQEQESLELKGNPWPLALRQR